MKSEKNRYNYIVFTLAALIMVSAWLLTGSAYADEKTDPEITYRVPENLNLLDESFCLNARTVNCTAQLSYSSPFPDYLQVDQDGRVTINYHKTEFESCIYISVPETETTKAKEFQIYILVRWVPQTITGKSKYSTTMGKPVSIRASAIGALSYKSSNTFTATVSSTGKVTFKHPGTVTIHVRAENTGVYWVGTKDVKVSCKMTAPSLKVTRPKKGCAKLTWSQVGGAQKYMIYVKYPGKKKYKPVATRSKNVKSVTHKNLKSGKKYSYKIRACLICEDGVYYGPFSKVKTVRIR